MCTKPSNRAGFTVIELMVTVSIAALLLTLAIPSFQEIIKRNRVASQNNELIALIHLARNEAIRRNPLGGGLVTLEISAESESWEGSVRPPGDVDTAAGCPDGAIRCSSGQEVALSGATVLRFDNRGYSVDATGSLIDVEIELAHVDWGEDRRLARCISVQRTGQVQSNEGECVNE